MISVSELIAKIRSYHPNLNEALVQKAYILSKTAHGNQKRHSGDPYFSHPLAVAEIIVDLKLDQESIITALLHDVAEDTEITIEEIEKSFGEEIAKLVDAVTKLGNIESISSKSSIKNNVLNLPLISNQSQMASAVSKKFFEGQLKKERYEAGSFKTDSNKAFAENFRKLTLAMSEDIRVLIVKLADRLHNMRTISYMPSQEKRVRKAKENLEIYAVLAGRIGLDKIKSELQELSFEVIDRESRADIVSRLNELRERKRDLIEKIINDLTLALTKQGVKFEISGREKKPYSIWMKMKQKNIGFHSLNDIMAFRIIVADVVECYRVLGVINSNYSMIPGTFSDYISTPKENGYQSLHLAILGPFNKKIEIQIRDQRMHEISEFGVAAHWCYKDNHYQTKSPEKIKKDKDQYHWIRELVTLFEHSENASEVLRNHKFSLSNNEVFCFTPNGDVFNLPLGSTAIDFAYAVHSQIGNFCSAVKINGAISPLRKILENGDQVEVITEKNAKPSPNWLQFAVTAKAKSAIKHFIRNEKFSEYSNLGRAILNKFFAARNLQLEDKNLEKILPIFHKKSIADLCFKIADGTIQRQEVFCAIYPDFKEEAKQTKKENFEKNKKLRHALPIEGLVNGMAIYCAGCCNPIHGDPIVGIINTGTGVTIHNRNCHNLKNFALLPQKILDVCWKEEEEFSNETYGSVISVLMKNKSGSLADVSSLIAKKKVNINNIKIVNRSTDFFELVIDIAVKNVDHLEEILSTLRISKKIVEVKRL